MPEQTDYAAEFSTKAGQSIAAAAIPDSAGLPVQAQDAVRDASEAIGEVLDAGKQVAKDIADLEERQNLIPKAGLDQLTREARQEAKDRVAKAQRRYEQSVQALESSLADHSLGKLPASEAGRVRNAREHILLAVGDAQGGDMASRIMGLTRSTDDPDVKAALNSGWLDSLAIAKGAQVDRLRGAVRSIATEKAVEKGEPGWPQLAALKKSQVYAQAAFRHGFGFDD